MTMKIKDGVTYTTEKGTRPHQEDRYFFQRIQGKGFRGWFLAVLDGCGGTKTVDICARELDTLIPVFDFSDPEQALRKLVAHLQYAVRDFEDGSTFSAVCIREDTDIAFVAILGDSPVFIWDEEKKFHMSPEHNVDNATELEMAVSRGGNYAEGRVWGKQGFGIKALRVLGVAGMGTIVSHEPVIYSIPKPRWIALATDGLFKLCRYSRKEIITQMERFAKDRANVYEIIAWARTGVMVDNTTFLVWNAPPAKKRKYRRKNPGMSA